MDDFYRRHLPHLQPAGGLFSVSFRLAGSLPQGQILALQEEQKKAVTRIASFSDEKARAIQLELCREAYAKRFDEALHASRSGPRWLVREEIAAVVAQSLAFGDGRTYNLLAYCLMPNHGHALIGTGDWLSSLGMEEWRSCVPEILTKADSRLTTIMASFKRYSATRANRILGQTGAFWQDESYDHLIRDGDDFERAVRYILMNPVRAGLCEKWQEWRWTYRVEWLADVL